VFNRASTYITDQLKCCDFTVKKHRHNWRLLKAFADGFSLYVDYQDYESVHNLVSLYVRKCASAITSDPTISYSLNIFKEFIRDGRILLPSEDAVFSGSIGIKMLDFISEKRDGHLKSSSIRTYELQLSRFLKFLHGNGIDDVTGISTNDVYLYIKQCLPVEHKSNTYIAISIVKRFLHWLYENHYVSTNMAIKIPSGKYTQQSQLPSVYTSEEVKKILSTVDRGNPTGKKDYLVLVLCAYLGLRSSDICNLRFDNIDWDHNLIMLEQVKTSRPLKLQLLPEVGNAIIDYLKYARPKSELRNVVLTSRPPYEAIKSSCVSCIVNSAIKKAGIEIGKRRHGPHALRHSLAARMLEGQSAMSVISEVLGHADTSSTLYYLRIDISSLKVCPLDVSPVPESFYEQFKWQ